MVASDTMMALPMAVPRCSWKRSMAAMASSRLRVGAWASVALPAHAARDVHRHDHGLVAGGQRHHRGRPRRGGDHPAEGQQEQERREMAAERRALARGLQQGKAGIPKGGFLFFSENKKIQTDQ
jgi:hypothetical protein